MKNFWGLFWEGRNPAEAYEDFLLHPIRGGLNPKEVSLVIVAGNPGLLKAMGSLLPDVSVQRSTGS